jgi:predicted RNA-binding Zn ribbon-like protein
MPRATRSAKLDTRTARLKLAARSAPYFVKLHQGLQLGYARGAKGGSWIGRRYVGKKRYEKQKLGIADDLVEADGAKIFDFWQAQDKAKAWAELARLADKGIARRGPYSVQNAMSDYFVHLRSTKGDKAERDAKSNATAHIEKKLGDILVAELTADRITRWRNELATAPKLVRTKASADVRAARPVPNDHEAQRKRRARAYYAQGSAELCVSRG